ncbi:uncharacterized protein BXZ73DRAFT_92714 [Epithele typhae]|uniref:uncharacterized protein n=1 Tax=Epithele typhae TaxID=378194 RepID=UPI002008646E|nr:uncharacterized protein BXZ73DRAFT_92714 [Epithele typhae]KAH9914875.1 hypothetical protein BXZ73DRAFT_92714 [Epithele typhae]
MACARAAPIRDPVRSSTAEITRAFNVDLQSGRNVIEIKNISSQIDAESPRIHGLGQHARVFNIPCARALTWVPGNTVSRNAEGVKKLASKKKEIDMLNDATSNIRCGEDKEAHLAFMDGLVQRRRDAVNAILQLAEQIDLWLLENTYKGETAVVITAVVFASRECKMEFQLTYLVSGVSWKPSYDLHAKTLEGETSPDASLVYCANIRQSTGEDCSDTVLTLSTATSQAGKSLSVPSIDPYRLIAIHSETGPFVGSGGFMFGAALDLPQMGAAHALARTIAAAPAQSQSRALAGAARRAVAPPPRTTWTTKRGQATADADATAGTVLDRSPLSLAYRVEGKALFPSDGLAHRVVIATLEFKAALNYVCVPRETAAVFIEGRVENTSEYELLAGPVSVFMDDGFVTKTSLGQSFSCVLGWTRAPRVVPRPRTALEPPHAFAERSKTTTRTVTTTIANGHAFDVDGLVVRDALPLGHEPAKIHVSLREPAGLARAHDGEDVAVEAAGDAKDAKVRWAKGEDGKSAEKEGLYEWVCGIPAGKKALLEVVCDFKMPAALRWREASAR